MSTWLLLEDEPDIQEMMLAMYDMLGVNGVAFETGGEAVQWIEAVENGHYNGEVPELALLDIRLPDNISGSEVAAQLRRSAALRHMVIVMMTAYKLSPKEEAQMMAEAGADYLLYKPLPPLPEMQRLLGDLIDQR